jgi:hypothetical protein
LFFRHRSPTLHRIPQNERNPAMKTKTKLCHEALRIGSSAVFSDVGENTSK